jgi:hypothetical protein
MRCKFLAALAAILSFSLLIGCFATDDQLPPAGNPAVHDTTIVYVKDSLLARKLDSISRLNDSLKLAIGKQDSLANPNGNNGGWDDFPNKYKPVLIEMATKIKQLPMPMGTRYGFQPRTLPSGGTKVAAAAGCNVTGTSDVIAIRYNNNAIYGVDTISYYDNAGTPHCERQSPTTRETHARHLINDASGEVWEQIEIRILGDAALPNYLTHGIGRMVLNNGTVLTIAAYDVDMIILNGDTTASVRAASLILTNESGYSFNMNLAKSRPFKTVDLFPAWGDNPSLGKILSGPITHPGTGKTEGKTDTLGYIDLYADHTVAIRDWTGAQVTGN